MAATHIYQIVAFDTPMPSMPWNLRLWMSVLFNIVKLAAIDVAVTWSLAKRHFGYSLILSAHQFGCEALGISWWMLALEPVVDHTWAGQWWRRSDRVRGIIPDPIYIGPWLSRSETSSIVSIWRRCDVIVNAQNSTVTTTSRQFVMRNTRKSTTSCACVIRVRRNEGIQDRMRIWLTNVS